VGEGIKGKEKETGAGRDRERGKDRDKFGNNFGPFSILS
jgi:hypothetical protein